MNHTIQLTTEQFQALQSGQPITIEPPKPAITKWEPIGGHYCIINYCLFFNNIVSSLLYGNPIFSNKLFL